MKKNTPLISVIIPVYNVEKYIRHCLDSVINQTYSNLEIVIVDDGSTDNSGEICDEYALKDSRIKVYHKPNGGLASARNYGLDRINGEYLYYIDSDDWVNIELFEKCVEKLDNDVDIIFVDFTNIHKNNSQIDIVVNLDPYNKGQDNGYFNEYLMKKLSNGTLYPAVWFKLYKFNLIKDIRFFEGKNYEDVEYSFLCMARIRKYAYLHNFIGYYYNRVNENSITYILKDDILDLLDNISRIYDNINNHKLKKYAGSIAMNRFSFICKDYKNPSERILKKLPQYARRISLMKHLNEDIILTIKRILMYIAPLFVFRYVNRKKREEN